MLLDEEQKDRTVAFVTATAIYVVLFLILLFIKVWQAEPPKIDSGIELNFGLDNVGSGDIQTRNRPSTLKNREESKPAEPEKSRPVPVKTQPEVRETPPTPSVKTPKVEEQPTIVSKVESPVKVAEKVVPKKVEPVAKPTPPTPKPVVVSKPVEAPPRQADAKGTYKKGSGSNSNGTSGANGTVGTSNNPGGNNNGDDASGVGDKGSPEGKPDSKGLYGRPGSGGGGGGGSLNITGWIWTSRPVVNDPSAETGKIVLQIKVDDRGDLISVKITEKTVSQSVADLYKRAVERLSFRETNPGATRPTVSTGTITFVLRSR
ncbi:MAG: hypothetical protein LH606_21300 [Cytophagaceae bacterium]|nr:hypothetical protein [Cytophagaceae bacterium]